MPPARLLIPLALAAGCTQSSAPLPSPTVDAGDPTHDGGAFDAGAEDDAGGPEPSPAALVDPEDIGFGDVALGETAVLVARFSRPFAVGALPPGLTAVERAALPGTGWTVLELRLAPTELGHVEGALEVEGRRVPITGRGVGSALRMLPRRLDLGDLPGGGCREARLELGNAGLGPSGSAPITLSSVGATATWLRPPPPGPFQPLEARVATASVCFSALGVGRILVEHRGERLGLIEGRARGPELAPRGPVRLGPMVVGLPKVVTATLANPGQAPLEVRVEAAGPVRLRSRTSFVVAPGRTEAVELEVTPTGPGPVSGGLEVTSSDAARPALGVPLEGVAEASACRLRLEPSALDFGRSTAGAERAVLALEHAGPGPCAVLVPRSPLGGLAWRGWAPGEPWDAEHRRLDLPPAAQVALHLELDAPTLDERATPLSLLAAAGGPTPQEQRVDVRHRRAARGLSVAWSTRPGCVDDLTPSATLALELESLAQVEVQSIQVASVGSRWGARLPATPFRLEPGAPLEAILEAARGAGGVQVAAVEIAYRVDGEEAVLRAFPGLDFSPRPEALDEFEQLGVLKVDVLWVVDGSASMADIGSLEPNLDAVAADMAALDARWAFVSADATLGGALLAPPGEPVVLDSRSADFTAAARRRLAWALGTGRSQLEQPLDAARLGIEALAAAGHLRRDAVLLIVALGDEDDASPGSIDTAVESFLRVKGFRNTNLFAFAAVAGPGRGCAPPATADPVPRLQAIADRTGGVLESPCHADWARTLWAPNPGPSPITTRFFLTNEPRPDRIRVFVDGAEVPRETASGEVAWSYRSDVNAIALAPSFTPRPGAHVAVRYSPRCR